MSRETPAIREALAVYAPEAPETERVPPGYRQTEVGVIPEDWEVKRFAEIASPRRDRVDSRKSGYQEFCIELEHIESGTGRLLGSTSTGDQSSLKSVFQAGNVLFGKLRSYLRKYWLADRSGVCSTEVWVLSANRRVITPEFLFQIVRVNRFVEAASTAYGTHMPRSDWNVVKNYEVALPSLEEQRAIAAALSDVDALIATLDSLISKKRAVKTAAMQQLLTGKQRLPGFSGEWSNVELGELGHFSKGKGIRKDEVAPDGVPCIRYGEIYTLHHDYIKKFHSFIPASVAQDSQRIRQGDLLFTGSGETIEEIGKCVAYLDDQEAYAGGDIVIFSPVNADSTFLGYLMNHPSVVAQKSRMGQGDAVAHISASNLARLSFALPHLEEQTAIAAVLSDMDAEIEALEARREKTRRIKQGMMQELLTGRTRLGNEGESE